MALGLQVFGLRLYITQRVHRYYYWVVVKIMVTFWVPNIIRHLIFRVPKKGP